MNATQIGRVRLFRLIIVVSKTAKKRMRIKDLPARVTAATADWLPGTHWLGFTPTDASGTARERCRATINSQINGGYVIEYVTRRALLDDLQAGA
jgi:hypothetical protein